jgi:hypothetical protein
MPRTLSRTWLALTSVDVLSVLTTLLLVQTVVTVVAVVVVVVVAAVAAVALTVVDVAVAVVVAVVASVTVEDVVVVAVAVAVAAPTVVASATSRAESRSVFHPPSHGKHLTYHRPSIKGSFTRGLRWVTSIAAHELARVRSLTCGSWALWVVGS